MIPNICQSVTNTLCSHLSPICYKSTVLIINCRFTQHKQAMFPSQHQKLLNYINAKEGLLFLNSACWHFPFFTAVFLLYLAISLWKCDCVIAALCHCFPLQQNCCTNGARRGVFWFLVLSTVQCFVESTLTLHEGLSLTAHGVPHHSASASVLMDTGVTGQSCLLRSQRTTQVHSCQAAVMITPKLWIGSTEHLPRSWWLTWKDSQSRSK